MNLNQIHNIYFIGIGGIGMSALARYFHVTGKNVSGYDKTPSDITRTLEELGVTIHFDDSVEAIDRAFLNSETTLIVYTPAIPEAHKELNFFMSQGFQIMKRSQLLGLITENTFCLAVAGTHGKTTTTSILGHLLKECGLEMTAFLGGIAENYNSNLILQGNKISVVEADEFDRSFLSLSPDYAGVTSMDADHLDIYGKAEFLEASFVAFTKRLKPNGKLFVKKGLPLKGITYAIEEEADYKAYNIRIQNGAYIFNVQTPLGIIENIGFSLPGRHNLSNALLALAMAVEYGVPHTQLIKALATFKGVKRRFSVHYKTEEMVYVDDYAHHPEEINALHSAIREMYPNRKVLAIFQPHLFSRTQDFADEFAASLAQFDALLLLDIYPARELPIQGVTSQWLLDKIDSKSKKLIAKKEIISEIQKSDATIVVTVGAGDIGAEVEHIKKSLEFAH